MIRRRLSFFSILLLFVILCIYAIIGVKGDAQVTITIDSSNLDKTWKEFVANPGKETALKVYGLLPARKGSRTVQVQEEVREMIFNTLHSLESRIYRGEEDSLKVAFRLFTIADSKMETSLVKIIGYLLRYDTRLFLKELQEHEHLVPNVDLLVCSFQLSSPNDTARQKLEKNIRLKALSYIEDKELKAIKKKCIKILNKLKID
jgi:hypothetical protein